MGQYDTSGIYIRNDESLTNLSNKIFGSWNVLLTWILDEYDRNYKGNKKPGTEKYEEEKRTAIKNVKSYSIATLQRLSDNSAIENKRDIVRWFETEAENLIVDIRVKLDALAYALKGNDRLEKPLSKDNGLIGLIKDYLDSVKRI